MGLALTLHTADGERDSSALTGVLAPREGCYVGVIWDLGLYTLMNVLSGVKPDRVPILL